MLLLMFFPILSCERTEKAARSVHRKTVRDYFGEEIFIADEVDRIIPIFNVQSEYMCILGAREKIVGVGIVRPDDYIFERIFPDIYKLPVVGAKAINLERMLQLEPDVVLCGHDRNMIENIERLNLIAVGTFPKNINGIFEQIRITGSIVDKESEAERMITFLRERLTYIRNRTTSIPENERPRVYYARYYQFETMGEGIYSEMIDVAGGENVVSGFGESGEGIMVSLENIYKWNPDIIILRDKAPISADALYNDPKWKNIKAILNGRIYRQHRNWSEFRVEAIFGIMEKAKWFHPHLFRDLDPGNEYELFFKLIESFYN
jgi:iron complex transport system substrate-binding protein